MIDIDLRAVSIPAGTRVWRLFPGEDYKFLDAFIKARKGFLDLPAFEFPVSRPLKSSPELLARILASQQTKKAIAEARTTDVPAFTNWSLLTKERRTSNRSRFEAAVVNFYQEAKQGDYVITPSTLSQRRIFLGRFASNATTTELFKYGRHGIPARDIDWLGNVDEGKLSEHLAKSLRHQHPFSLIERSRFLEVFALANASYQFGTQTVATVYNRKNDFLDSDAALMGVIAKLAAAACAALDNKGQIGDPLQAVVSVPPIEYTCSQESDIHSEGFTRFISGALTPLVISAMLAILLASDITKTAAQVSADAKQARVINTLSPNDPCIPSVDNATKMILNSVDIRITYELCKAAHAAKDRAGLDPSATAN
ncbi:MAG: hypothetical protein ACTHJQ_26525 [Rhizobiaceae bacterium]